MIQKYYTLGKNCIDTQNNTFSVLTHLGTFIIDGFEELNSFAKANSQIITDIWNWNHCIFMQFLYCNKCKKVSGLDCNCFLSQEHVRKAFKDYKNFMNDAEIEFLFDEIRR